MRVSLTDLLQSLNLLCLVFSISRLALEVPSNHYSSYTVLVFPDSCIMLHSIIIPFSPAPDSYKWYITCVQMDTLHGAVLYSTTVRYSIEQILS